MKKINTMVEELQNFIESVIDKAEAPVKKVLNFVKKHRKLIFAIVVAYLVFKYVFGEESDENFGGDEE